MKFLIIGPVDSLNTLDLEEEIKKIGNEVDVIRPIDLIFETFDKDFKVYANGVDLEDYDVLLFRGYNNSHVEASIFAENALHKKKILLDEIVGRNYKENKLNEASLLSRSGIKHPKSYYIKKRESLEFIKGKLNYPVIVKPIDGSKGRDIYKLKNEKELVDFLNKNNSGWLIQECLEIDGDVRVFVVNGRVLGAMKRYLIEGDYRSNVSLGAKAEKFELTKEIKELALSATKAVGREIAGVDLAYSKGKWYVIEVNATPQWQGFKKAIKINPAEAIIKFAIEKFNKSE
jgi:RimK family alpha-L-glutamate ligase